MVDMSIRVENSFEIPNKADWKYLESRNINAIRIDIEQFSVYKNALLLYPRISECIFGINNKVGSLCITYVLCRHYYDIGIPDEPWYVSPSLDGKKSIQYMPNFQPEHYMRRFWFNHFAANLYVTAFSIWDSIVELLNIFYDINAKSDLRQREEVIKCLKAKNPQIADLLTKLKDDPIYKQANDYRNKFVHGLSPSDISEQIDYKKDVETQIIDSEASIATGKAVYEEIQHATVMSLGVGHYTPVREVIETFDQFALLTASKKDQVIEQMVYQAT